MLGSMTTIQDWVNTMHDQNQQFENDGVQARINRSLKKAAAEKVAAQLLPWEKELLADHNDIDPVVYGIRYHEAMTNALRNMWVG